MQDSLREQSYAEGFTNILSPLDPSLKIDQLRCTSSVCMYACVVLCVVLCCMHHCVYVYRPEKCKFMDSKMKPLWLVFENADKEGKDIYQIFKHGDGT